MKNQPGNMKNQPGIMKNHENRPGTVNNQPGTMNTHENRPGTINKQKRYKQTDTQNLPIIYRCENEMKLLISMYTWKRIPGKSIPVTRVSNRWQDPLPSRSAGRKIN